MVLEKTLESTLDCKEIKPVNPKRNHWKDEYSLEGLMLKIQYFGHLMQTFNSLEKTLMPGKTEGKRRRGQQSLRWLDSTTDSGFEHTPGDSGGQRSLTCCSSRDHKGSDTTLQLNNKQQHIIPIH